VDNLVVQSGEGACDALSEGGYVLCECVSGERLR
jgi:hypothetical protein